MGAGKSTLGPEVAARLGRSFFSLDDLVAERAGASVAEVFTERGEGAFRELEEQAAAEVLARRPPAVVELGGGALGSPATRAALRRTALTMLVDTTAEEAWERVKGTDRPLARDERSFRLLFAERAGAYDEAADARARDVDGAVLAAAGVHVEPGALSRLGRLVPGDGPAELVADATVSRLHGARASGALGSRLAGAHEIPAEEAAKSPAEATRLWSSLRLDRDGTLVALGGGSTLDVAGFVAATYLRGIPWAAVPTTLLAQVDAAIGGKTAVDLPEGKNLVGAFHWPARAVIDVEVLATLPQAELQDGLAEVVKTGLLVGEPLWELDRAEQVRRCAAVKAGICLRDPDDRADRTQLNLGHTFAHALEAASGFALPHGRALALGLQAALRLSNLEDDARLVAEVLRPEPVQVDRDAAWAALARDKKARSGALLVVLLDAPGRPRWGVELDAAVVRAALDTLIA